MVSVRFCLVRQLRSNVGRKLFQTLQWERRSVLVDVRMARSFETGAMPYSVNVPLYEPISGWGVAANVRRAGFAFFGIYGTQLNTAWLQDIERRVKKGVRDSCCCMLRLHD
jgi:hypothetical protein